MKRIRLWRVACDKGGMKKRWVQGVCLYVNMKKKVWKLAGTDPWCEDNREIVCIVAIRVLMAHVHQAWPRLAMVARLLIHIEDLVHVSHFYSIFPRCAGDFHWLFGAEVEHFPIGIAAKLLFHFSRMNAFVRVSHQNTASFAPSIPAGHFRSRQPYRCRLNPHL